MMDSSTFLVSYSVRKARTPPRPTADLPVKAKYFVGVRGLWEWVGGLGGGCKEAMAEHRAGGPRGSLDSVAIHVHSRLA